MSESMQHERGCLPFTNCLAIVPQDKYFASEVFGSFRKMLSPGLRYAGFDLCGVCISLKSISTRVEQILIEVPTKTKDNVFVQAVVATQFQVAMRNPQDALYKLSNVTAQIDSYVSDIIRSQVPSMNLDEAFEEKDHMSSMVQQALQEHMTQWGWVIHKALVLEIRVNPEVMQSMNEINRQKRLRDATLMAAEADKIRKVKAAEADADAACLAGEGIARQRGAIIDGLRASIQTTGRELNTQDISQLLLVTQYFETLKDIGSHDNCKAYILPKDDPNDMEAQVRLGMLQGEAALEFLQDRGSNDWQRGPAQQDMEALQEQARQRMEEMQRQQEMRMIEMQQQQMQMQQDQLRQAQMQHQESVESFEPPPPMRAPPQRQTLQIQVPPNAGPGSVIQAQMPDGRMVQIQIPPGVQPGQVIQAQV